MVSIQGSALILKRAVQLVIKVITYKLTYSRPPALKSHNYNKFSINAFRNVGKPELVHCESEATRKGDWKVATRKPSKDVEQGSKCRDIGTKCSKSKR